MINVDKLRLDFPVLRDNPKLAYLDNAASAIKPDAVINAVNDYYTRLGVNVHRGVYKLSYEATDLYEEARHTIERNINKAINNFFFIKSSYF